MEEQDKEQGLSFEQKLHKVQEMITEIEGGKLPLEESVRQYETGMKLLQELDGELAEMNRRLTVLQDGKETEVSDAIL